MSTDLRPHSNGHVLFMISFMRRHLKNNVILLLVRWYAAYVLSHRDIEALAAERGFRKRFTRPVGVYASRLQG